VAASVKGLVVIWQKSGKASRFLQKTEKGAEHIPDRKGLIY
jgi:hypothetical protein